MNTGVGRRLGIGLIGMLAWVCGAHAEPADGASVTEAALAEQVMVQGARLWREPEQTRLVIDLAASVAHQVFALGGPERVVIDLVGARLMGELPVVAADEPLIAGLRSGVREARDLRIVVDLKQPVRVKSFLLAPNETYGYRLVVDLAPKTPGAAVGGTDDRAAPAKAGTARELIIAIDAGHGGEDPGALGPAGTREKDITLAIARKLATRVDKHPGLRAVLIRDGDYFMGLRQRIEKARQARADMFVSIHADAFTDGAVRGSSVFTLSAGGATSEAARWLAERENQADLIGGIDLREHNEVLANVLLDMTQNATIEHSGIAATKVLEQLRRLGEVHQQQIQQAGFAVLKSPDVPSLLVETAFISNPEEEKRLRSTSFQNRVADAVLGGIIDYFTQYPPPDSRFARQPATADSGREHRIAAGETLSSIAARYQVPLAALRAANRLPDDRLRVGQVLVIPGG